MLVLVQHRDIQLTDVRGRLVCANTLDGGRPHHLLAITETCKLLRRETLGMFYDLNTFFLHIKPDLTNAARAQQRRIIHGQDSMVVFRRWLRCIGTPGKSSIKHLTFDLGFWSPLLPIEVDMQEGWWKAAREGATLLRASGLSSACNLNVHLTVRHYPSNWLWFCSEYGEIFDVRQSFELVLPTQSDHLALVAMDTTTRAQRDKLMEHVYHGLCSQNELGTALENLVFNVYMLLRAFDVDVETCIGMINDFCHNQFKLPNETFDWLRQNARSYG